jgi:L-cysteate sulfo-lyase
MASLPDLPRVRLLEGPTPLQALGRLSAALGERTELWIKREDLGPLALSGNKLRNLEFLLGAALEDGAETIVTSGRRWSNHCRLTAAAGARLGLVVHVIVSGPAVAGSVNVRLMRELGATVHEAATDDRAEREGLVRQVAADAERAGARVRVLPVGGSEPIGAWGQVLGSIEALEQAATAGFRPDTIILPTATGGTQAGLVVGAALASTAGTEDGGKPIRIGGIAVHPDGELRSKMSAMVDALAAMAGIVPPAAAIELDERQIGPGYGLSGGAAMEAARLLATTEGILVDPVYTAKGLAGLIAIVRSGALDGRRAIFWDGGGLPALFEPELGR